MNISFFRPILSPNYRQTGRGCPSIVALPLHLLKRWGGKCVNPEYDRVKHLLKMEK